MKIKNIVEYRKNWNEEKYKQDPTYFIRATLKTRKNNPEKYNKDYFIKISHKKIKNNPEKYTKEYFKNMQKIRVKSNPEKYTKEYFKNIRLKTVYNITLENYDNIVKKQNNKCLVCKRNFNILKSKDIHIDHNHKTNKIRGILCNNCNTILGHSKDNIKILKNAIKYLEIRK